jgi:hypothetical protein
MITIITIMIIIMGMCFTRAVRATRHNTRDTTTPKEAAAMVVTTMEEAKARGAVDTTQIIVVLVGIITAHPTVNGTEEKRSVHTMMNKTNALRYRNQSAGATVVRLCSS